MDMSFKKLNIICGHYGSGKTNIAVNLALKAKALFPHKTVRIADYDIVNPYFRAADNKKLLTDAGIVVSVPQFANSNVDIPVVPHMLGSMIEDSDDSISFVDLGGDDGAVAIGMFSDKINQDNCDMFYVVNKYRPLISAPEDAVWFMREIENAARLKCTMVINNSSLGEETAFEDIFSSVEYGKKCAENAGLPLFAHTYCENYVPDFEEKIRGTKYSREPFIGIRDITKKLF